MKKRKTRLLCLLLTLAMALTLCACGGDKASSDPNHIVLEDCTLDYKGAVLTQDSVGNDTIVITLSYTNTGKSSASFLWTVVEKGFQNGVERSLSAMEDYRIDIMIDKGPSARSIQIDLNPFTLVGATTRSGLLTAPLRARFGINLHLEYYDDDILSSIVRRSASILDVPCSARAASEIASRSRGTPRIANALLRRVRDFAQVKGSGSIDTEIARFALEALNIDKYGLDEIDNKILCTIIDKFKGGPVGITTIATALGEDAGTIEEVYEPFLIKEGFMKRTPRGREVTELAYKHLGRSLYNSQKTLFND